MSKIEYDAVLIREEDLPATIYGDRSICLWELTPEDPAITPKLRRFYVTYWSWEKGQMTTAAPGDFPSDGGTWVHRGRQASAICYVANGRKLATAQRIFRKLLAEIKAEGV